MTGAAGLIGTHLGAALRASGYQRRGLTRSGDALPDFDEVVPGDVLVSDDRLLDACRGCEVVFHAAAHFAYAGHSGDELYRTAVAGTENVLQACAKAGVRRVVVTSSSVVFGYAERRVSRDETAECSADADDPPYVQAKCVQHRRALELGAELDLEIVLACPTITIGPTNATLGPSNGLIVGYLADPFRCTFPGGCNLVSATDVARGHLLVAEKGVTGESYLLGSQDLDWAQIHAMVGALAGVGGPKLELGHSWAFLAASAEETRAWLGGRPPLSTREQAMMIGRYYWYSHAKAAALGYAPQPARAALIAAISWLAASPHVSREMRATLRLAPEVYRFRAGVAA